MLLVTHSFDPILMKLHHEPGGRRCTSEIACKCTEHWVVPLSPDRFSVNLSSIIWKVVKLSAYLQSHRCKSKMNATKRFDGSGLIGRLLYVHLELCSTELSVLSGQLTFWWSFAGVARFDYANVCNIRVHSVGVYYKIICQQSLHSWSILVNGIHQSNFCVCWPCSKHYKSKQFH